MPPFSAQQRFWSELVQLKAQACYLNAYHIDSERKSTAVKVFLAVASSSSIGAWVIWRELGFLWGAIVAGAQVLNAVRPYLPWEKRARAVYAFGRDLADTLLMAEKQWHSVAEGVRTEADIHDMTMELKRRRNEAEMRHLEGRPLPFSPKHEREASERATKYFATHYGIGGLDG